MNIIEEALLEFIGHRTPVNEYIAKRYGSHDPGFREVKRASVTLRISEAYAALGEIQCRGEKKPC